jgi:hypothetical protein
VTYDAEASHHFRPLQQPVGAWQFRGPYQKNKRLPYDFIAQFEDKTYIHSVLPLEMACLSSSSEKLPQNCHAPYSSVRS